MRKLSPVLVCILAGFVLVGPSIAGEREEQERLAPKYGCVEKGVDWEVRLRDNTRVDLLPSRGEFKQYAIEVDFATKWAEAIGQSRHYARLTGRKPAILLLIKNPQSEIDDVARCAYQCGELGIELFLEFVE